MHMDQLVREVRCAALFFHVSDWEALMLFFTVRERADIENLLFT